MVEVTIMFYSYTATLRQYIMHCELMDRNKAEKLLNYTYLHLFVTYTTGIHTTGNMYTIAMQPEMTKICKKILINNKREKLHLFVTYTTGIHTTGNMHAGMYTIGMQLEMTIYKT